jgi:hypothetical protein
MSTLRIAAAAVGTLVLAGCAGSLDEPASTAAAPAPALVMAGRWMLSAPNAPPCGMNFGGAPGAREGSVAPEGGCPGNFFMSRRWTFLQDALMINDRENTPLAQLKFASDHFEGQSTSGTPVTLSRALPSG